MIYFILITLLLSAFFSGIEMAFVSTNKLDLALEKKTGTKTSKILEQLTQKPARFITTMLIGNNLVLVVYSFLMGKLIIGILENDMPFFWQVLSENEFFIILLQTLISTVFILIFAEFLPKMICNTYAVLILKKMAIPAYFFYLLFYYPSAIIIKLTNFFLKFLKNDMPPEHNKKEFSRAELGNYIEEQLEKKTPLDSEIKIFKNALEFKKTKAREVMVPRIKIVGLEMHESMEKVKEKFMKTGLSKILIYKNSLDSILGYVHSFEMFQNPKNLKNILLPVLEVPESMPVNEILNALVKKNSQIAVVIDEYGGTSGMMTTEDIVEELFGEIEDEHDKIAFIEKEISNDVYHFSAQLEIDYLNEKYDFQIPKKEDYETLGGFILDYTEHIPRENEKMNIHNFQIQIIKVSNTKIEEIIFCKKT